jgi:hypothetical protein
MSFANVRNMAGVPVRERRTVIAIALAVHFRSTL